MKVPDLRYIGKVIWKFALSRSYKDFSGFGEV